MTALKREGLGSPDLEIISRERTDSHTRVWRGTLGRERERGREIETHTEREREREREGGRERERL